MVGQLGFADFLETFVILLFVFVVAVCLFLEIPRHPFIAFVSLVWLWFACTLTRLGVLNFDLL